MLCTFFLRRLMAPLEELNHSGYILKIYRFFKMTEHATCKPNNSNCINNQLPIHFIKSVKLFSTIKKSLNRKQEVQ